MRSKRPKEAYRIDAVEKTLRVLEAVESDNGQPVHFGRILGRVNFTRDFVMRALATLEINGFVVEQPGSRWTYGPRFLRLAISAPSEAAKYRLSQEKG